MNNVVPTPEQSSMSDRAYAHVKQRILDGTYSGASLVSEGEIADELGTSRTPVREAFLRLQAEGWMKLFPKRGAMILPPGPDEGSDLLEARILIETNAARAVENASAARRQHLAAQLREILKTQHEYFDAKNPVGFAEADVEFHQELVRFGDNPILTAFFRTLGERQQRMTTQSVWTSKAHTELALKEHQDLIDKIEHGDADGLADDLREHLENVRH